MIKKLSQLKIDLANFEMRNPAMLAAGILGSSGLSLRRVWDSGAGAVVTKSLGLNSRVGSSNPSVVEVDCGFLNAIGLSNPGVKEFIKEVELARLGGEIKIIASLYGGNEQEFIEAARIMDCAKIDALELNFSCPNVKGIGDEIGKNPKLVGKIIRSVNGATSLPIFAKLSPNISEISEVAKACEREGSDAIVAINTIRGMAIDTETTKPILANRFGGLSGPAIKPIALRFVYEIFEIVDIPIIGCGGISNYKDAIEFMLAGATAFQIGTAIVYGGLSLFKEITEGIENYLKFKKYHRISDIVGLSHKN